MSNSGVFDRVLGSMHCLPDGATYAEPWALFEDRPAASVVRDYLAEVARMVSMPLPFDVLAHIDYPMRFWPAEEAPFAFENLKRSSDMRCQRWLEVTELSRSTLVCARPAAPSLVASRWRHSGDVWQRRPRTGPRRRRTS